MPNQQKHYWGIYNNVFVADWVAVSSPVTATPVYVPPYFGNDYALHIHFLSHFLSSSTIL